MNLVQQLEGILFFKGEPVAITELAKLLEADEQAVEQGLAQLQQDLSVRGIVVVRAGDTAELRTHPDLYEKISEWQKVERGGELSKSALETLSIIMYSSNGITKAELDYIRGVNSTFILRNLLIRGLIQKMPNPDDKRSPKYAPTTELLGFLGISSIQDMPEFDAFQEKLKSLAEVENPEESTQA